LAAPVLIVPVAHPLLVLTVSHCLAFIPALLQTLDFLV
jgi:hypothetical protein